MEYLATTAWTILFTVIFLVIYKYVINPQVVVTLDGSKMNKCPDGWDYDFATNQCYYNSPVSGCLPFNPDDEAIQSAAAKCNLARQCGTTWNGACQ
ncbi:MAG: hypothetical protein EB127_01950 [Alphaproteobacteria bacterium]|nr:hypothetical protein [Alphaproteobacteria bacterium]